MFFFFLLKKKNVSNTYKLEISYKHQASLEKFSDRIIALEASFLHGNDGQLLRTAQPTTAFTMTRFLTYVCFNHSRACPASAGICTRESSRTVFSQTLEVKAGQEPGPGFQILSTLSGVFMESIQ